MMIREVTFQIYQGLENLPCLCLCQRFSHSLAATQA